MRILGHSFYLRGFRLYRQSITERRELRGSEIDIEASCEVPKYCTVYLMPRAIGRVSVEDQPKKLATRKRVSHVMDIQDLLNGVLHPALDPKTISMGPLRVKRDLFEDWR